MDTHPDIIRSGFRKGGIYPFNADAVSSENYDPMALKRWEEQENKNKEQNVQENAKNDVLEMTQVVLENGEPGTSHQENNEHQHAADKNKVICFEELLLATVKQTKQSDVKQSRRRVAGGAELITSQEVLRRLQAAKETKGTKAKNRR